MPPKMVNEMLKELACLKIFQEKELNDLTLGGLGYQMNEPIDDEIIQSLKAICKNLATLDINEMMDLPKEGRLSMIKLVKEII